MRLRRDRPPAAALAALDAGEDVVSWADTSDGDVVIATPLGLLWPDGAGLRRIGWQFVSKAVWRDGALTVVEGVVTDDLIVDCPPVSAILAVPRDLPPSVRKRVELNIVSTEIVSVDGGAVRFVGRRIPGRNEVAWWARLEPGTPHTAATHAAVRARLALLAERWRAATEQ